MPLVQHMFAKPMLTLYSLISDAQLNAELSCKAVKAQFTLVQHSV